MTSLKTLQRKASSLSSFSHIETREVLSVLERVDISLQHIAHSEPDQNIGGKGGNGVSQQITEYDVDQFSPLFIEEDAESSNKKFISSSPSKKGIKEFHPDNFYRVCQIGRGAKSNVYMVLDHNRERFALKVLDPSRLQTTETFITAALDLAMEAKILSELDHENIIQLRGVCAGHFSVSFTTDEGGDGYFLVLDLLNETLSDNLSRLRKENWQKTAFSSYWKFRKSQVNTEIMHERMERIALGIAKGMVYLHNKGIVIRDLKPTNIGFDECGKVRLFDFGMARKLEDCDPDEICGSPRYMPPEVMTGKGYSFQSDVYSFGVILYEICSLNVAFENARKCVGIADFNRLIIDDNLRPTLNNIACPLTKKLIEDCWQRDSTKRPSFDEIYKRLVYITSS